MCRINAWNKIVVLAIRIHNAWRVCYKIILLILENEWRICDWFSEAYHDSMKNK